MISSISVFAGRLAVRGGTGIFEIGCLPVWVVGCSFYWVVFQNNVKEKRTQHGWNETIVNLPNLPNLPNTLPLYDLRRTPFPISAHDTRIHFQPYMLPGWVGRKKAIRIVSTSSSLRRQTLGNLQRQILGTMAEALRLAAQTSPRRIRCWFWS
ncbi:MAG: hypothetical protein ACD_2C00227G0001, partial [uncultured bacterium (gcode 4)]